MHQLILREIKDCGLCSSRRLFQCPSKGLQNYKPLYEICLWNLWKAISRKIWMFKILKWFNVQADNDFYVKIEMINFIQAKCLSSDQCLRQFLSNWTKLTSFFYVKLLRFTKIRNCKRFKGPTLRNNDFAIKEL